MAKNKDMRNFIHNQAPFLSRKYTAGESIEDAIRITKKLNSIGIRATINKLGEDVSKIDKIDETVHEYLQTLDQISELGLKADIAVKLSTLGLAHDEKTCRNNLREIVKIAKERNVFVWVDMEEPEFVEATVEIFEHTQHDYNNVGICLQAYLPRTDDDIKWLLKKNARIRMVKGVYLNEGVIHDKNIVRDRMMKFSIMLLKNKSHHAIATHDEEILKLLKQLSNTYAVSENNYELQFLYGMKVKLQQRLLNEGHDVNVYLPYGHSWTRYTLRRLGERF